VPGPTGKVIYTGYGMFTNQLKPLVLMGAGKGSSSYLPAAHGDYFLRLEPVGERGEGALSFYLGGMDQPFARLASLEGIYPEGISYGKAREKITHDKRVHFIPAANLLITIPGTNDKLVLHRFDPEAALEKSDVDYLLIRTTPTTTAKRGEMYRYKMAVKSKKGGVKIRLESGPEGMKVSAEGEVTWKVPAMGDEQEVDIILAVTDKSDREVFQSFKVQLRE
jgi:hypothetical protein